MKKTWSLHHSWIVFFGLWFLFLTGFFEWFRPPHQLSPGLWQAWQLRRYFHFKQKQERTLDEDIQSLQQKTEVLAHHPLAQEIEIRKVLGYAASDELIFDLSHWNPIKFEQSLEKAKAAL